MTNEHIDYFSSNPVLTNETLTDSDWIEIENHALELESRNKFTEEEARTLFEAINDDLYGVGSVVTHVLINSDNYPQRWIFEDNRDESDHRSTADFIIEQKHFAFEEAELKVDHLPNFRISDSPLQWVSEAMLSDLNNHQIRKWVLYGTWEAFRAPLTGLGLDLMVYVRDLRSDIESLRFDHESLESLRIHTLELIDQTLRANTL